MPFVYGAGASAARMVQKLPVGGGVFLDVLDPATAPFFHLLNAGNAHAYGGMAMPAWVQLDCAALPSAIVGFARPIAACEALRAQLLPHVHAAFGDAAAARAATYTGLLPVAQYTAVPTLVPGVVVGFSLFALEPGLGVRSKALALRAHGARVQRGVAQLLDTAAASRAVRTHLRFGALEILAAPLPIHSRPEVSFVYAVDVPSAPTLDALAHGEHVPVLRAPAGPTQRVPFAPQMLPRVLAAAPRGAHLAIEALDADGVTVSVRPDA